MTGQPGPTHLRQGLPVLEILSAAVLTVSHMITSLEVPAGSLPDDLRTDELKKVVLSYLNASQTGSDALLGKMYQQLQDYCEREDVYRAYIQDYYGNQNGWFAFQRNCSGERNTSMIDIAAKMLKEKIIVHDRKISGDIIFSTQEPFSHETHVIYDGHNHFYAPDDPELHQDSLLFYTAKSDDQALDETETVTKDMANLALHK